MFTFPYVRRRSSISLRNAGRNVGFYAAFVITDFTGGTKTRTFLLRVNWILSANKVKEQTRSLNMKKANEFSETREDHDSSIAKKFEDLFFQSRFKATPRLRALLPLAHAHKKNMDYSKPAAEPRNFPCGLARATHFCFDTEKIDAEIYYSRKKTCLSQEMSRKFQTELTHIIRALFLYTCLILTIHN